MEDANARNGDDPDCNSRIRVSVRDYYCYKFQMRRGIFNPILHGGRLFQQFAVDMYIKVESSRLDYVWNNQKEIRADLYQGLMDSIQAGESRASAVGKRTVLPASFVGGGRNMKRRYMDAMALVQKYGKPDVFLTMTSNPKWDEITRELEPVQTPQDRPDLVVRVFRAKLEDLKKQLFEKHILGKTNMTASSRLSFQTRKKYPELYNMVVKHMMHGPCGRLNGRCQCMRDGKCRNNYPREFNPTTSQGKDSYPLYRRRNDGKSRVVRGHPLDNRWVVPYNPYLLRMYNCHMNVEVCSSIKAVKYLFKYHYKGHDKASISINEANKNGEIDEIQRYRDARWVIPPEALWCIYGFDICHISPSVRQLQLHLPNMHMLAFDADKDLRDVLDKEDAGRSMLTAYFEANRQHVWVRDILYRDFPMWFTWQTAGKYWKKRDRGGQVGRIVCAHPAEGERYYLRVLLNHVAGSTSFEDLRTVDGVVMPSFRAATERRGLIEADNTLDECLTEARVFQMPASLRRLFATILVYCEPSDVRGLWDKHLDAMSDDYRRNNACPHVVQQMVLIDIRGMLQSMGKEITSFSFPEIDESHDSTRGDPREIIEESSIGVETDDMNLSDQLNDEQRSAFNKIMNAVGSAQGGVFFVDGPGGTGKTFLYSALLATVRSKGDIAVATATSGVAASIMPGGRTAHSWFKIPLNIEEGSCCSFTKQSGTAKLLQMASLIIWDEASMTKRQAVSDNRCHSTQVLSLGLYGSIEACSQYEGAWFANYLLRVGNGTEEVNKEGLIGLPSDICGSCKGNETDLERLIDTVFPNLNDNLTDPNYITCRAILSTRNEFVDRINMKMIERFRGDVMTYHSFDRADDDPHNYYPPEFLNSLTPNGLPPHVLKLKINCPIMLLRNIDPANGLCNGTRLVVRQFGKNAIDAEIVVGQHAGKRVFLPRIPLCPSDDEMFPFRFKRKQFPVRLSFALTINKAQGQTIPNAGVYLPEPVFSHGQLYVVLSRATSRTNIKILSMPVEDKKQNKKSKRTGVKDNEKKGKELSKQAATYTKNIVFREVLTD
ncbi:uncharacterized protein [Oryza sativa Japonica Group]|uniref:uncharacterized protein n=1 Tax=Oryza sativa subsp. japonica TaxID=39947 RepID=UPI00339CB8ED